MARWNAVAMRHYFTRATKLAGLAEIAVERGAPLHPIMRDVGIDPAALRNPEMTLDYAAYCELLRRCARAWDLPDLGFRMARHQRIEMLGPVALVTRMERTVRAAVKAVADNLVIHSNATVVALEEPVGGDTACLILGRRHDAPECREDAELVLANSKTCVEQIADTPMRLVEVSFRHEKGASARAAAAYFDCPVRFGAERDALCFDRALLDRPLDRTDVAYHALIKRYLATARLEVEQGLAENVRTHIARQMELGHCTLDTVAQSLRIPPRSLQRRLQSEGTSFRDLMDEWRRARALSLVTQTRLPLSAVAEALGYSDQSVFTQAFRRWYGGTPLRYRSHKLAAAM